MTASGAGRCHLRRARTLRRRCAAAVALLADRFQRLLELVKNRLRVLVMPRRDAPELAADSRSRSLGPFVARVAENPKAFVPVLPRKFLAFVEPVMHL